MSMEQDIENKLQQLLDNSLSSAVTHELTEKEKQSLEMYERLIHSLEQQPLPIVPLHFSPTLVGIIQAKRDRKQTLLLYVLFSIIVIAAVFVCSFAINIEIVGQLVTVITDYISLFLFCITVVVLVHFVDRKTVSATLWDE